MFVLAHVAACCGVCCVYVGFLCTCMHVFCCVDVVPSGPGRSSFLFPVFLLPLVSFCPLLFFSLCLWSVRLFLVIFVGLIHGLYTFLF